MAIALDIIKKKTWLDDTMAQQALDIKNSKWNDAFKEFVNTNKPVQTNPPVTPITPAPIQNAPVDPNTGLSKPLEPVKQETPVTPAPAPAPVEPLQYINKPDGTPVEQATVPEPVKAPTVASNVSKENITQSDFQKAQAESEKIKAQNDAKMAENAQKAQLEEQKRHTIAKETVPTNQQDVLNSLVSGISVPEQKTEWYRNAKFQYEKYSRYNAMTPTQLLDNLKQGQISTEMDKLLSSNPNYIQAKQDLNTFQKVNNINNSVASYVNGWKEADPPPGEHAKRDIWYFGNDQRPGGMVWDKSGLR